MNDCDVVMDRFLVHDCPEFERIMLPAERAGGAAPDRYRCEFCGFDWIER